MDKDVFALQEYVEDSLDWITEAKFLTEEFLLLDNHWEDMRKILQNLKSIDGLLKNARVPIIEVIRKAEEHLEILSKESATSEPKAGR